MVKKWRLRMSKTTLIASGVLCALGVVCVGGGLLVINMDGQSVKQVQQAAAGKNKTGKDAGKDTGKDAGKDADKDAGVQATGSGEKRVTLLGREVEFDSEGFAKYAPQKNPRDAAIQAANLFWSVDGRKVKYTEDWLNGVVDRLYGEQPGYKGPFGYSVDVPSYNDVTKMNFDREVFLRNMPDAYRKLRWCELCKGDVEKYGQGESQLVAKAIAVYSIDEVKDYLDYTYDTNPTVEGLPAGSKVYYYYVRQEVFGRLPANGSTFPSKRVASALAVYCDPPQDGGLCGMLMPAEKVLDQWPRL